MAGRSTRTRAVSSKYFVEGLHELSSPLPPILHTLFFTMLDYNYYEVSIFKCLMVWINVDVSLNRLLE